MVGLFISFMPTVIAPLTTAMLINLPSGVTMLSTTAESLETSTLKVDQALYLATELTKQPLSYKQTTIFLYIDKSTPYEALVKVIIELSTIAYIKVALISLEAKTDK